MTASIHFMICPGIDGKPPTVLARAVENGNGAHTGEAITANTDVGLVARAMLQSAAYLFAQGQPVEFGDTIPREVLK